MKPLASLSLDADNLWAYRYIRGDQDWADSPSYLPRMVPRVGDMLGVRDLHITFFVVGRDAIEAADADGFRSLAAAGHEIGNHSFRHEPWLHRYSEDQLDEELARAEDAIVTATGRVTTGFRGPGYSLSEPTLRVLIRRGYQYDASTLPTVIGPVARQVYFRTAQLTPAQRVERAQLYGTWADGVRPLRPYRWRVGDDRLLELPVTTMPGLRVPIHISYLLMLSVYSAPLADWYFAMALRACRRARVEPSILMHPLDVLSGDEVPELRFFPGMQIPTTTKLARVEGYLDRLVDGFEVVTVGEHAARAARRDLPERAPRFAA